ncbi:hypothetical protein [Sphingobacterium griseoflavum]|uniref:Membrane protease subunit n=1 Tax=Sphingobacterium griseoflavum TaxID=1474952 RepID=A0ABQ3HXM0_9SPHI|nr:hypothetical protein [Sphingobacterium griseoflavum]GHE41875.1 hypothetical protein GCM10017764_26370 [Sphingobacterium griseoflavum]
MKSSTILFVGLLVIALILGLMFGLPQYSVWQQEMAGKARLAEATQSRQILIEQARAEKEAATLQAEAIKIMGEAAQKYPEYRKQEFIGAFGEALKAGTISQIIYVPTEANIPILEAGKQSGMPSN